MLLFPNLGGGPERLLTSSQSPSSVQGTNRPSPAREGGRKKSRVKEPGVLEEESRGGRDLVEAATKSGTWSDVVRGRDVRDVSGKVAFQRLLKKTRSSLARMGGV